MQDVIQFILQYKDYIVLIGSVILGLVDALFAIIGFIVVVCKVNSSPYVKEYILENLPGLISEAEKHWEDGKEKKEKVIKIMLDDLKAMFPKLITSFLKPFISLSIEKILNTPQKKEVK